MSAPPDSWQVFVDRNQLENAILNLAINARDAMKGEGTIDLSADNIGLDRGFAQARALPLATMCGCRVADRAAVWRRRCSRRRSNRFSPPSPTARARGWG